MTRACRDSEGVILIALVWILTALSIIALSFSREGFVEVAAARNSQDLTDAYFIARAGLVETIYRILKRPNVPAIQQLELQTAPDPIDLGTLTGTFGDGQYTVDIQDESGKLNINMATEDQIHALCEAIGIPKPDSDIITDSIVDWKDVDNLHRINGAEDDYYESLNPPYKAKNTGRLDTVEELLLVRGVTPDYFYGHPEKAPDGSILYKYGLSRYVTVYSMTNRINVNYAPVQVLMSIPGVTPQMAQMIYERRKTKPFANLNEITQQLPVTIGPMTMPFLSTDRTGTYTLTATAHRMNSKAQRVVRAVVVIDPREATRYRIVYWNENVPNL